VLAQSGLARDVAPGEKVFGTPARPVLRAKRLHTLEEQLPEIVQRLRKAEQRLQRLERQLGLAPPETTADDDER
jgi:UDP-3-O-[3-hydroxymyristoyl] glucosamine N-acyltransferase